MSSFIQRTYDQLSQDLALNNSPATILVYAGGISSMDMTHLGIFDISMISNIPNIIYLSPTNKEEYLRMLEYSFNQNQYSIAIRVPSNTVISTGIKDNTDYSILNKFKLINEGSKVAIIACGNFFNLGNNIREELKKYNISATLINPRFLTGLDNEMLNKLLNNHKITVTLEDGILDGGFGEKISRFYSTESMKVLNYGAKKIFTDRVPVDELYEKFRLKPNLIVDDILKLLK